MPHATVQTWPRIFPRNGKSFRGFSTQWKKFSRFFHAMEKVFAVFPHNGTRRGGSTVWKTSICCGWFTAAVVACALPVRAGPALITVGQGWAWVREFFPPSDDKEIDRIVWTNPPPQLDLDTLQVWNVRRPWPIQEWRWLQPDPSAPPAADKPLVWHPRETHSSPPSRDRLEIRLAEPLSHSMGHSLTYRLPDFDWTAFYRVTVRGIGPESIDVVQVDLTAFLRIQNGTATAYPDARVSLLGADTSFLPPPKPFGLLDLNPDTALTDLWLTPRYPAPLIPSLYALQTEAAIPANGQAEIQFARVLRKPAQITHICDSDNIPAPTPTGGLPLRRALLIPNIAAMGLGFPLPPGQADLFLGALRGAPFQSGHVLHTPFPGMFQLDMGPVDTVRASRQAGEAEPLPGGAWQSDHALALVNNLASPVRIQVVEKPATPLQWNLVRSSIPCSETTRALHFDLTLPPKSTKTITYRLHMLAQTRP
jgi:hypothetical protein